MLTGDQGRARPQSRDPGQRRAADHRPHDREPSLYVRRKASEGQAQPRRTPPLRRLLRQAWQGRRDERGSATIRRDTNVHGIEATTPCRSGHHAGGPMPAFGHHRSLAVCDPINRIADVGARPISQDQIFKGTNKGARMGPLQSQPTLYRLPRRPQAPGRGAGFVYMRLRRRRIIPSPSRPLARRARLAGSGTPWGPVVATLKTTWFPPIAL